MDSYRDGLQAANHRIASLEGQLEEQSAELEAKTEALELAERSGTPRRRALGVALPITVAASFSMMGFLGHGWVKERAKAEALMAELDAAELKLVALDVVTPETPPPDQNDLVYIDYEPREPMSDLSACCEALRHNAASAPPHQKGAYLAAYGACKAMKDSPDAWARSAHKWSVQLPMLCTEL